MKHTTTAIPVIDQDIHSAAWFLRAVVDGEYKRIFTHYHHNQVRKYADKNYPAFIDLKYGCDKVTSIIFNGGD